RVHLFLGERARLLLLLGLVSRGGFPGVRRVGGVGLVCHVVSRHLLSRAGTRHENAPPRGRGVARLGLSGYSVSGSGFSISTSSARTSTYRPVSLSRTFRVSPMVRMMHARSSPVGVKNQPLSIVARTPSPYASSRHPDFGVQT